MTEDDVLFGFRLRCLTLAEELGNVSEACRAMGIERSTYYRWKAKVDRWGMEALRVRERRRPRMPNQIGPHLEQRILAFALARPGLGPRRISSELRRPKWGGIRISEHGVWRVLRRFNLNTRAKRLALVARHAEPYERRPEIPPAPRHIEASEPGEKVQFDCFFVGRLSGSKGTVWQYTASDVASGFIWSELHSSERNPRARWTAELVHRVARELRAAGWGLQEVTTDNGSEFRSQRFRAAIETLGAGSGSSRPATPTPTAASSAPSSPSSRSAGDRRLPARWRPRSPPFVATWRNTSTSSTSTAPTTGG